VHWCSPQVTDPNFQQRSLYTVVKYRVQLYLQHLASCLNLIYKYSSTFRPRDTPVELTSTGHYSCLDPPQQSSTNFVFALASPFFAFESTWY
jgi:hypothetical protein